MLVRERQRLHPPTASADCERMRVLEAAAVGAHAPQTGPSRANSLETLLCGRRAGLRGVHGEDAAAAVVAAVEVVGVGVQAKERLHRCRCCNLWTARKSDRQSQHEGHQQ